MVDGEDASVSAILAVVDGHLFQAIGERQRTRILSRSKEDESLSSAQLETWRFHVNSLNFNSILLSALLPSGERLTFLQTKRLERAAE